MNRESCEMVKKSMTGFCVDILVLMFPDKEERNSMSAIYMSVYFTAWNDFNQNWNVF